LRRRGAARHELLALLLLVASALVVGCQRDTRPTVLQGLIVDMQAASFVQVGSFTLRTNDGQLIELAAEGDIGITAGHMREHMTLADPVAVTVRYDGDRVIATRVDDAPAPTRPAPAT
jgi:hypothetical protein